MRRSVTFLCLSFVMCVIVCLQLVNHFLIVRNSDSECNCDTKLGDESRARRDAKRVSTSPIEKSAKLDEYVSEMLELLGNMNEVEQAQLGTNFKRLYAVLQDIKDSKNGVTNTRKLNEEIIPSPSSAKTKSGDTQEVCPEKFLGDTLTYGYPFFRKGFATLNCTQFVPMEKLVTVVFDDVYTSKINPPAYERVLKGIAKYYPTLNVVYVTKDNPGGVEKIKSNVKTVRVKDGTKQGEMWDTALSHVTTKYVLIAPQLTEFDDDIDFKRLVRILSNQPDVTFVSAAYRTRDGHWDIGCLQTMFQNYTLTLQGGYYISFWDCVVCDFIPGPWVARTKEVRELKFDKSLDFGVFYDIFWKIKKQKKIAVSCPDVMFNIDKTKVEDDRFLSFANKHDIRKLVEPNGQVRWYGCRHGIKHRRGSSCRKQKGLGVPPCDLENLADAVKLIMRECENAGLFCELQMGTLLGAVKFNGVLPWERDADLTFLTANYTAIQKLGKKFRAAGYSFSPHKNSLWCCVDGRQAGGEISMSADGWSIVLYGQHLMESEILALRGEAPTKIDFAGQLVTVVRNPGLFARNRYGSNLYRHQEHWLDRGKQSGWHFYNPGKFEGCPMEGHSGCLSQYSIDGNMQFDKNICPCTFQPPQR